MATTKTRTPAVGDPVMHHGRMHEITALPERPRMRAGKPAMVEGITFENDSYSVTMLLDDHPVEWDDAVGAWYFYGRLLARNERAVCEAITGAWPPAANHMAMRSMLDAVDLDSVDRTKLGVVMVNRKADLAALITSEVHALPKEPAADADEAERDIHGAAVASYLLAASPHVAAYVDRALDQLAELRTVRGA